MKKEEIQPLTREVKIAMIRALEQNGLNEESRGILNDYLNPDGITVEIIDSRLQVAGLTQAEFEVAVANIRREQFGGETRI